MLLCVHDGSCRSESDVDLESGSCSGGLSDSMNLAVVLWVPGRSILQILDFYTTWVYLTNLNLVTSGREAMTNIRGSVSALTMN